MSELTARLALYGAIDAAVVAQEVEPSAVADYLPTYAPSSPPLVGARGQGPAAGWYENLMGLEPAESVALAPPIVESALAELADLAIPDRLDAAHRLRALFLVRRLLPETAGPLDQLFRNALARVVEGDLAVDGQPPPSGLVDDAVGFLVTAFGDTSSYPGRMGLVTACAAAAGNHLMSSTLAASTAVPCEEATAYYREHGTTDTDVAAVVRSHVRVEISPTSLDELRLGFHPGNWPKCMPSFWRAMDPLAPPPPKGPDPAIDPGSGRFVYREHVGDPKNNSTWFKPVLEFWYVPVETKVQTAAGPQHTVDGFVITYGLADPLPAGQPQDAKVLIDDGTLTVTTRSGASGLVVDVVAWKTIALAHPVPSAGIAIFACAAGWADQTLALVTGCLAGDVISVIQPSTTTGGTP